MNWASYATGFAAGALVMSAIWTIITMGDGR